MAFTFLLVVRFRRKYQRWNVIGQLKLEIFKLQFQNFKCNLKKIQVPKTLSFWFGDKNFEKADQSLFDLFTPLVRWSFSLLDGVSSC